MRSQARFTFGALSLQTGIELIPMVMGLLGLAQVFTMLERRLSVDEIVKAPSGLRNLLPNREEWRDAIGAILRGTVVGFLVGILPGAGATISSYVAYAVETAFSPSATFRPRRDRRRRGAAGEQRGDLERLHSAAHAGTARKRRDGAHARRVHAARRDTRTCAARPEARNVLGHHHQHVHRQSHAAGAQPAAHRPVRESHALPQDYLIPVIVLACIIGAYGVNNNPADIFIMLGFDTGYVAEKFGYSLAPLVLAFVLGPLMETSLRQSLILSGDFSTFVERPISAGLLILGTIVRLAPVLRSWLASRESASQRAV